MSTASIFPSAINDPNQLDPAAFTSAYLTQRRPALRKMHSEGLSLGISALGNGVRECLILTEALEQVTVALLSPH